MGMTQILPQKLLPDADAEEEGGQPEEEFQKLFFAPPPASLAAGKSSAQQYRSLGSCLFVKKEHVTVMHY
ncbi:hypothetical protein CEXT_639181 [Caerostris extrusa]|uniref:Uncharacterized protein n=1 Tax=Caerostris extrusa TaxID=172846 RepID=A0AAV4WLE0_CAEEX|nr:hypothetical protein CEXT_639181 [Caerostris extrusa]